jgi:hypothetical protein
MPTQSMTRNASLLPNTCYARATLSRAIGNHESVNQVTRIGVPTAYDDSDALVGRRGIDPFG